MKRLKAVVWLCVAAGLWGSAGRGQDADPGPEIRSGVAPRFEMEYVAPEVHKWYAPRHLLESDVRPWYGVDARYAQEYYSRYVEKQLEGYEFYDGLGNPLGRGWLVYSWTQTQPQTRGSQVVEVPAKEARDRDERGLGFSAYRSFFQQLVIATDQGRASTYRLMVGDAIYTAFTPLTFYKPRFNGMRLDYAADRGSGTLLLSRLSDPDGNTGELNPRGSVGERTNATHLMGGHLEFPAGDMARLGFTFVNAHNAQTELEVNHGNPFTGALTTVQNQPLRKFWVRVRDDSPEDGRGGAVLIAHEIVLVDTSGRKWRGRELGLVPQIEGGVMRAGALIAEGADGIVLEYDLGSLEEPASATLRRVSVELTVADDYRIEMASDLQTDAMGRQAAAVFLPVLRAPGNAQDRSNTRVVRLDYGLPTGSEVLGVDWNLVQWKGFSVQGEAALNRQFGQYPNPHVSRHHQVERLAHAAYVQMAYQHFPWKFYYEGFSLEDGYSTRYWLNSRGSINYRAPIPELYEFVDDDDDGDAMPEWQRPMQPADEIAWPGYDENRDFRNDYNENANLIPDYEEPFLRFRADRPEFLFGLDMNHNGTVDRFENDDLPDYPYKQDHRGFNAYGQVGVGPELSLTVGRQRLRLIDGDGRTRAWYALGKWVRHLRGSGRLRIFGFGTLVQDDIADDLVMWHQPVDAQGRMREVADELPMRDTWKGTLYADLDQRFGPGLRLQHRFKWEGLRQRGSGAELAQLEGRRTSGFTGLIDKAEWTIPVGLGTVEPRWKSELRRERPFSRLQPVSTSLEEIAILLWTQPLLAEQVGVSYFPRYGRQRFNTELQVGLEWAWVWLLEGKREGMDDDFRRWTGIAQLSNRAAYEGYLLISRVGVRLGGWRFAGGRTQSTSLFFLTVNAGLD